MSKRLPQLMLALVALFGLIAVVVVAASRDDDQNDAATATEPTVTATSGSAEATDSSNAAAGEFPALDNLDPVDEAKRSVNSFLDRFVTADGQVTRDGADDTVSEGQAYAMLMSVAIGDRDGFDTIWSWTKTNLLGTSGTLAWHWRDGTIVDANAATDADVDAARALALAAARFDSYEYRDDAVALSAAVLTENIVYTSTGSLLAPGPWAADVTPYVANPSYIAPAAFAQLGDISDDTRWPSLADSGNALLQAITADGSRLPPDWMVVDSNGSPAASAAPNGSAVAYGYEAFRTLPRLAEACDTRSRDLAAALWAPVQRTLDDPSETANLDGSEQTSGDNTLFMLAAASAAQAAGDNDRADELLDLAERIDSASPTYYLGAWVALTRLMLDTDLLGGCATQPTAELSA